MLSDYQNSFTVNETEKFICNRVITRSHLIPYLVSFVYCALCLGGITVRASDLGSGDDVGSIPDRAAIKPPTPTQPSIPPGYR